MKKVVEAKEFKMNRKNVAGLMIVFWLYLII